MLRTLFALLGLAALASPATAADRRYSVNDFDRLIVAGPYQVRLVVGGPSSAVASGTREGLDRVTVDVQGRILRIRRNSSAWGGTPGADTGPVVITLATRSLRSARLIGPARLDLAGARGLDLELSVEGSGTIQAASLDIENLALALLGSGRLELAGAARALTGNFQGTGDVDASALAARGATVSTTTSGAVLLNVAGPVTVAANGLGEVTIAGRAICTISGPGADQVRCGSNQR
jgi:hypothetical protein